jgi:hypothetical protein
MPDGGREIPDLSVLQALPYMTALIQEGVNLIYFVKTHRRDGLMSLFQDSEFALWSPPCWSVSFHGAETSN